MPRELHRVSWRDVPRSVLLALLPVAVGLAGVNSLASHHGDEANYIQVAAHMLETGNYLVPVYHDTLVLDRAPLFYWVLAASFRIFGITLFAARLPTLLAAALLTILMYWFVVSVYGSVRTAVYATIAFVSAPVTWWLLRLAVPDMLMTVGVFLASAGYFFATASSFRRLSLLVASVGIGVAGMAKGHVGIVVACTPLVALVTIVDRGTPYALRARDLLAPWTWLPALVLCSWWYVFLLVSDARVVDFAPRSHEPQRTLGAALTAFLWSEAAHQVQGGWQGMKTNIRAYALGLLVWFFPWSLYVLTGVFTGDRVLRLDWRQYPRSTRVQVTVIAAVTILFTFFILELRSARYLLPITPAMAILAARCCVRREALRPRRRRMPAPIAIGAAMLALSSSAFAIFLPTALQPPLESLCIRLRPRLRPSDRVLAIGTGDKWATFATVLLGQPVRFLDGSVDAWPGAATLDAPPSGGSVYVLTTPQSAHRLHQEHPHEFQFVTQGTGGWIAQPNHVFEGAVALRVRGF